MGGDKETRHENKDQTKMTMEMTKALRIGRRAAQLAESGSGISIF